MLEFCFGELIPTGYVIYSCMPPLNTTFDHNSAQPTLVPSVDA